MRAARVLVLFNYDWDQVGFGRWSAAFPMDSAGFDLFSFPSNLQLVTFDLQRFVDRLAARAVRKGWRAVTSNHEQFGALAAALLAERMGWPGTPVAAVLACQHKLHARGVLEQVAPEANTPFAPLEWRHGDPPPDNLEYPRFVKPIKAAFSVLARVVHDREDLMALTRFGFWERWVIRHLIEPFERVVKARFPEAGSARQMLLEQPVQAMQYNLDGYVFAGELRPLGFVESVMYPGTQAFMRFDYPCRLGEPGRDKALDVARRFLSAVGFNHGLFNMEFFHDPVTEKVTVIEFNPRMAAQFSDLYLRVKGVDLHRLGLELALGRDPARLPLAEPSAGAAASFVYRCFDPAERPAMPDAAQQAALAARFPDALLFRFAKSPGQIARDFKWVGSYRYGILHLGGRDAGELRERCLEASELLGWPAPYARQPEETPGQAGYPTPDCSMETDR